tara:strand:- start:176 stop:769 length:594 start_codon:yes stop_codon:yes gene_type:complete
MNNITKPNNYLKDIELTIGFCGSRLSGKDFTADLISKYTSIPKMSLADPIKEQYSKLMDIPLSSLYEQGEHKEMHRLGLITLGALRRSDHIDWWCEALHEQVQGKKILIPDIRFTNEVEYFENNSSLFLLFEVSANEKTLKKRGWVQSFADSTSTETERLAFNNKINHHFDTSLWDGKSEEQQIKDTLDKFNIYFEN